ASKPRTPTLPAWSTASPLCWRIWGSDGGRLSVADYGLTLELASLRSASSRGNNHLVTPRPTIFISAVSRELKSARQLVANTLQFLGYEPVWQDIFGTEQGDLRAMLRRQIDE